MKKILLILMVLMIPCLALSQGRLHPYNKQLMDLKLMDYPRYFPEIPRITAFAAKNYYDNDKATFVLISHRDRDRIMGGRWLTEDLPPQINPNTLLLKKGHVLIAY